ncbi:hypothetical protein GCM10025883_29080 [Mobilicoccus caccae]|uniref:FecCD transport family protein n=1 Tax=Mobilicoccus caccae TaxID=1859295 RepID=A0ABQ6IW00_9MICO|nr:hypothetical protein GCM10025883_29080 [Mobilicoccus caccae]
MTATQERPAVSPTLETVRRGRIRRRRARLTATCVLAALVLALFVIGLMVGQRFYGLGEVVRVVLGEQVPGASVTVGELRLPRVSMSVLAGAAFGLGGITFQTMLRNPWPPPTSSGSRPEPAPRPP